MTRPRTNVRRGARTAACIGLFLAAGLATATAMRRAAPGPENFAIVPKLAYLREHVAEYDVVFVGSSRVFRGFVPEVFDATLAEHGRAVHSFNLAARGMFAFEADHVLRRLLALPGFRARTVLVEPGIWEPVSPTITNFTERAADWHTAIGTRQAIESTWMQRGPLGARLELAGTHLELFGRRLAAYGRGPDVVARLLGAEPQQLLSPEAVARDQGWQGFDVENMPNQRLTWEALRADPEGFQGQLVELRRQNAKVVPLDGFNVAAARRQVAAIRAAGAEPIYVVPPGATGEPLIRAAQRAGLYPLFLAYDDPDAYPELYDLEARHDRDHLGRVGAERFTRILADHYARLLARQEELDARDR